MNKLIGGKYKQVTGTDGKEYLVEPKRTFYVCIDCHKTVYKINKDGECKDCERETAINRGESKEFINSHFIVCGIK